MGKKIGIYGVCLLLVIQTLAGCAEMTEQQSGAAIGAGAGALLGAGAGALLGGGKGAAIGAGAGALLGAGAGWFVGEYRAKKVKDSQQAVADKKWTPKQGVMAKVDSSKASPVQLKPGDQIVLQTEYTVLAPPEKGEVTVKEVRTILFNNQPYGQPIERTSKLAAGTYITEQPLTLPRDMESGTYTVTTVVEPVVDKATKDQGLSAFVVQAASK